MTYAPAKFEAVLSYGLGGNAFTTRTHSMAGYRKSPYSRRNLMVIDPLTQSQGHQFDHRLNFFSVSWSTAHPLKFDMPLDHVQKIKFLTPPQGPRWWGPKKLCCCMCHSC